MFPLHYTLFYIPLFLLHNTARHTLPPGQSKTLAGPTRRLPARPGPQRNATHPATARASTLLSLHFLRSAYRPCNTACDTMAWSLRQHLPPLLFFYNHGVWVGCIMTRPARPSTTNPRRGRPSSAGRGQQDITTDGTRAYFMFPLPLGHDGGDPGFLLALFAGRFILFYISPPLGRAEFLGITVLFSFVMHGMGVWDIRVILGA